MKSYDFTLDKPTHPNVYVNPTAICRFDRMPTIKKIIAFSFLSVLFPLSTLLADVCPANTEDLANNYKNQGYTIFHCESNSFSSQIESVNDNINIVVCGTGSGDITTYEFADPYNRDQSTKTMAIDDESQGGDITVSNVWAGFTSIDITCSGDFYIAYKPEDLMAAVNPADYSCCPAGSTTCESPDMPVCSSSSGSDGATVTPYSSGTIDSVDYKGTTFQGGNDGKDYYLFNYKTINNVTFTDITIELANENDVEAAMSFANAKITNTIFKDNDELPSIDFVKATLDEVEFQNTTLYSPDFRSTMKKVEFINSVLLRPEFTGADLSNTTFDDTIICDADLTDATFDQDTFKGATVYMAVDSNREGYAANVDGNIIDQAQAPKECPPTTHGFIEDPSNPDTSDPDTSNPNTSDPNTENTIDSVDYKGTTFQGGWDGKDLSLFSEKTINNVTFTDITIEIVNENGGEPGLLFNNSTITNTIFKDNDDLPPLNFEGSTLDEVEFQNYTLKRPIFFTANMKKVEFINSVLLGPNLNENDLSNTTFDDTIICDADLTDATFDQDTFKGATVYMAYTVDNGTWVAANIDGNIIDDAQAPKECQNYQ